MRMTGLAAATALAVLAGAQQAAAQDAKLLSTIKGLKCSFPVHASGTWTKGEPKAEVKAAGMLTFQVTEIDTQESSARVIGMANASNIVAQLHGPNLHLLDLRPSGSLTITTVFAQESRDKKLKAVHTRTDYLPVDIPGFTSLPDAFQYYGECEIVQ